MSVRRIIKAWMPQSVLQLYRRYRAMPTAEGFDGLTTQQIFSKIYEEGAWGNSDDPAQKFYSGKGSHDQTIVSTYVQAVQGFLASLPRKPDAVDLGCGDFAVGSKLRHLCNTYVACDIVPQLIAANKARYRDQNVEFRVLDFIEAAPPVADIVFVRQVLQHLSNRQIRKAVSRIANNYKYLVLTEHLPATPEFTPNLNKPAGPHIRVYVNSGVVLTRSPFNLQALDERILCDVPQPDGIIRTTVYTLS